MKRKKKKAVKFFVSFFFYSRIVLGEISKVKPNGSGRDKTDTDSFFHLNHLGGRCVAEEFNSWLPVPNAVWCVHKCLLKLLSVIFRNCTLPVEEGYIKIKDKKVGNIMVKSTENLEETTWKKNRYPNMGGGVQFFFFWKSPFFLQVATS